MEKQTRKPKLFINMTLVRNVLYDIKNEYEKFDMARWAWFKDMTNPEPEVSCLTTMCFAGHVVAQTLGKEKLIELRRLDFLLTENGLQDTSYLALEALFGTRDTGRLRPAIVIGYAMSPSAIFHANRWPDPYGEIFNRMRDIGDSRAMAEVACVFFNDYFRELSNANPNVPVI